ncbi:MAG: cobalamin biosynthesis protein CbiG [Alphaproteobacteria bacterium]
MPAFDAYVMVDWSAARTPKRGRDSIWIACVERHARGLRRTVLENPATRAAATGRLGDLLVRLADGGKRVLAGFDFPFGYPVGTGARLGHDGLVWRRTWAQIADLLDDADDNANNRFDVAETLNRALSGEAFPFWGNTERRDRPFLKFRGRRAHGPGDLSERRLCEARVRTTKPVWQLAYNGSVGSQALTGIPRVWQLRTDARLAFRTQIWPFETGLADAPAARVILAEVYPSILPPENLPNLPKDAGQVSAMAKALARWDDAGRLAALMAGDPGLSDEEVRIVETEEAWILGVTDRPEPLEHAA